MSIITLKEKDKLLLIKPSSMGDVIHALPFASALYRFYPNLDLTWVVQPAWAPLLEEHPGIKKKILFPRNEFRGIKGIIKSYAWSSLLKEEKPDLVLDLQGLLRSALMAYRTGAPIRIGMSDSREGASFFYTHKVRVNPNDHALYRLFSCLELFNITIPEEPEFFLPQGVLPSHFSVKSPYVLLHPYSRGEGKSLNFDQIRAFALGLGNLPLLLVGQGEIGEDLPSNVLSFVNQTTLLELIALIRKAAFVVSSDSGPMHLAAALRPKSLLAIHRWSDPWRVGPWHADSLIWKKRELLKRKELREDHRSFGRAPTSNEMREMGEKIRDLVLESSL